MNTEIVKINKIDVICPFEKGEQYIAVKPICDILGIDSSSQFQSIKEDEILSSTMVHCTTVGADSKMRDMNCLPLRYVFGWLFSIDTEKVKPEAKQSVIKYKRICYDVLFDHFMGPVADRKRDLTRKVEIDNRKAEIEDEIAETELGRELLSLNAEERKIKSALKVNDKALLGTQLNLFEK